MVDPVKDRDAMIAQMSPELLPSIFVFCTMTDREGADRLLTNALASFREKEGTSLILSLNDAERAGFDTSQPMACITLNVHSALDGVGLTAAVSTALAEQMIPCNMVAGFHHDHAFVPVADGQRAIDVLHALSERAS